ncbi:unnamed protein product [Musa textilis]
MLLPSGALEFVKGLLQMSSFWGVTTTILIHIVFWHFEFLNFRSGIMNGSFNGQILVDKLAKLNNTQQSIETLSHWCIFHMNKATQVVETWERQFYCSPREQRVSFLYLANDILQNSRRKGLEFINEFWKVLPDALTDVFGNGDDFGRKTVLRLVDIWDERKVFGSRGQILKEEISGRRLDNGNKNVKAIIYKSKQSSEFLEKIISSYDHVCDEDALFRKCQSAISIVDKVEKELGSDVEYGSTNGSEVMGELQMQHRMLGECIEQLKAAELCRATLISYLKEALHEQEIKIEQVRHQLQEAESRYERATDASAQLNGEQPPAEQRTKESSLSFSETSPGFAPEATAGSSDEAQITSTRCTQEEPLTADINSSHSESEHRRTAAAEVAAKLTASASSAQMLCHVLSSLASEGVIGPANKEDFSSDNKRLKTENGVPSHVLLLQPPLQPPLPSLPHPQLQHQLPLLPPGTHPSPILEPLPPTSTSLPSAQPPPPPLITTQFMPSAAGPMTGMPYGYGSALPPLPNYPPMFGIHLGPSAPNPFHSVQASDGANPFAQPPLPAPPPSLTRQ